ncbi:hypothetical protein [Acinetobacter sp. YH16056]|uniref:hypothetical protein n=1 Tax=Acinetobacter sp. YH16056 TaxID=2601194 RepID=UPI0015D1B6A6|nr:hypothetical protein [Acinetobacter sp. YH16056]
MKFSILALCLVSILVTACGSEKETNKTDETTQKDWADRNKSNIDFEKHESKGY